MEQMNSSEKMFSSDPGFLKIKKSRFWIGVLAVLVVIFLVGILSGVLSAKREKELADERYANAKVKRETGRKIVLMHTTFGNGVAGTNRVFSCV